MNYHVGQDQTKFKCCHRIFSFYLKKAVNPTLREHLWFARSHRNKSACILFLPENKRQFSVIGPSRGVPTDLGRTHGQLAILNIYQQGHYTYSTFCINIPTTHVGVWGDCVPHTVFLGLPSERQVRFVSQSKYFVGRSGKS
jgi:hypothetical protein